MNLKQRILQRIADEETAYHFHTGAAFTTDGDERDAHFEAAQDCLAVADAFREALKESGSHDSSSSRSSASNAQADFVGGESNGQAGKVQFQTADPRIAAALGIPVDPNAPKPPDDCCNVASVRIVVACAKPIALCDHEGMQFFAATGADPCTPLNGTIGLHAMCKACGGSWVGDVRFSVAGVLQRPDKFSPVINGEPIYKRVMAGESKPAATFEDINRRICESAKALSINHQIARSIAVDLCRGLGIEIPNKVSIPVNQ